MCLKVHEYPTEFLWLKLGNETFSIYNTYYIYDMYL